MSGFGLVLANYIRRGFAFRWVLAAPTVLLFALVTLYVSIQPDSYESRAVLMRPIAKAGQRADLSQAGMVARNMFRSAAERLLSSKMLRNVVDEVDPYPELRDARGVDAVVERLRKSIRIESKQRTGVISIYVTHSAGDRAAEVSAETANSLSGGFVKAQLEAIAQTMTKVKAFLDSEKSRLRGELETAEKRLDEFKAKHSGSLPDDVPTNLTQIARLGQSIVDTRQNQRMDQHEVNRLNRAMARLETELHMVSDRGNVDLTGALEAGERRLANLNLRLQDLRVTFEADSREVQNALALIKATDEGLQELRKTAGTRDSAEHRKTYLRFLIDEYKRDRGEVQKRIGGYDKTIASTQTKIEAARARIVTASTIDSRLSSLERSANDANGRWQSILVQHQEAERRKKFGDYDPEVPIAVQQRAFVPARPASPDRLTTSMLGMLLGLGIGIGLAVAQSKLDVSYQRADQLRALLPGAVLVTIPDVTGSANVGKSVVGIFFGLFLTGLFAATVAVLGIQLGWWGEPELIQPLINLR